MVGFPHLVAVPPRSLQEHIVRPAGKFTAAQAGPVAAQDVASHSPLQRLAARRRRTATLRRLDQLPVHRGNVAPPERQPLPHLISHLETAPRPLIELTPGPARLDPPPHSPLRDIQTLSRELHMPPSSADLHHPAPSGAGPRPLEAAADPAKPDSAHPRPVSPSMDPPARSQSDRRQRNLPGKRPHLTAQ